MAFGNRKLRGPRGGVGSTLSIEEMERVGSRVQLLQQRVPTFGKTSPEALLELAGGQLSDDEILERAMETTDYADLFSLKNQLDGSPDEVQNAMWAEMPGGMQAALEAEEYEPPSERKSDGWGWHLDLSKIPIIGTEWDDYLPGDFDLPELGLPGTEAGGIQGQVSKGLNYVTEGQREMFSAGAKALDAGSRWHGNFWRTTYEMSQKSQLAQGVRERGGDNRLGGAAGLITQGVGALDTLLTNPTEISKAFSETKHGEYYHTEEARGRAHDRLSGSPDADFKYQIARYVAAGKGISHIAKEMTSSEPGSPQFNEFVFKVYEMMGTDEVMGAVSELENGKVSWGRSIARTVGLLPHDEFRMPGTDNHINFYDWASGGGDMTAILASDPLNLIGPVGKVARVSKLGSIGASGSKLDHIQDLVKAYDLRVTGKVDDADKAMAVVQKSIGATESRLTNFMEARNTDHLWKTAERYHRAAERLRAGTNEAATSGAYSDAAVRKSVETKVQADIEDAMAKGETPIPQVDAAAVDAAVAATDIPHVTQKTLWVNEGDKWVDEIGQIHTATERTQVPYSASMMSDEFKAAPGFLEDTINQKGTYNNYESLDDLFDYMRDASNRRNIHFRTGGNFSATYQFPTMNRTRMNYATRKIASKEATDQMLAGLKRGDEADAMFTEVAEQMGYRWDEDMQAMVSPYDDVTAKMPGSARKLPLRASFNSLKRSLTRQASTSGFMPLMGDDAIKEFDMLAESGALAHMDPASIRRLKNTFIAGNPAVRLHVVRGFMEDLFTGMSVEKTDFARGFLEGFDEYYSSVAGGDIIGRGLGSGRKGVWMNHYAGGLEIPRFSQLTRQLPDGGTFLDAIKNRNFARATVGNQTVATMDAALGRIWKPLVMMRMGFILRAGGEEALQLMVRYGPKPYIQSTAARMAQGKTRDVEMLRAGAKKHVKGMNIAEDMSNVRAFEGISNTLAVYNGRVARWQAARLEDGAKTRGLTAGYSKTLEALDHFAVGMSHYTGVALRGSREAVEKATGGQFSKQAIGKRIANDQAIYAWSLIMDDPAMAKKVAEEVGAGAFSPYGAVDELAPGIMGESEALIAGTKGMKMVQDGFEIIHRQANAEQFMKGYGNMVNRILNSPEAKAGARKMVGIIDQGVMDDLMEYFHGGVGERRFFNAYGDDISDLELLGERVTEVADDLDRIKAVRSLANDLSDETHEALARWKVDKTNNNADQVRAAHRSSESSFNDLDEFDDADDLVETLLSGSLSDQALDFMTHRRVDPAAIIGDGPEARRPVEQAILREVQKPRNAHYRASMLNANELGGRPLAVGPRPNHTAFYGVTVHESNFPELQKFLADSDATKDFHDALRLRLADEGFDGELIDEVVARFGTGGGPGFSGAPELSIAEMRKAAGVDGWQPAMNWASPNYTIAEIVDQELNNILATRVTSEVSGPGVRYTMAEVHPQAGNKVTRIARGDIANEHLQAASASGTEFRIAANKTWEDAEGWQLASNRWMKFAALDPNDIVRLRNYRYVAPNQIDQLVDDMVKIDFAKAEDLDDAVEMFVRLPNDDARVREVRSYQGRHAEAEDVARAQRDDLIEAMPGESGQVIERAEIRAGEKGTEDAGGRIRSKKEDVLKTQTDDLGDAYRKMVIDRAYQKAEMNTEWHTVEDMQSISDEIYESGLYPSEWAPVELDQWGNPVDQFKEPATSHAQYRESPDDYYLPNETIAPGATEYLALRQMVSKQTDELFHVLGGSTSAEGGVAHGVIGDAIDRNVIEFETISRTSPDLLPTRAYKPRYITQNESSWDNIVRWWFEGPVTTGIAAMVRTPQYHYHLTNALTEHAAVYNRFKTDKFDDAVGAVFNDQVNWADTYSEIKKGRDFPAVIGTEEITEELTTGARRLWDKVDDIPLQERSAFEDLIWQIKNNPENAESVSWAFQRYVRDADVLAPLDPQRIEEAKYLFNEGGDISFVKNTDPKSPRFGEMDPQAMGYKRRPGKTPQENWQAAWADSERTLEAQRAEGLAPPAPLLDVDEVDDLRQWMANEHMAHRQHVETARDAAIRNTVPFIDDHRVRSQFQEHVGNLIPFWFAEENMIKRWGRTLMENPGALRRLQLSMHGARQVGIIKKDQYGNDVVVVPGGELANQVVHRVARGFFGEDAKVPINVGFSMNVDYMLPGISGEGKMGIPQVGPMVAVPMTMMSNHYPELQGLTDTFTMGTRYGHDGQTNWAQQLMPSTIYNPFQAVFGKVDEGKMATNSILAMQALEAAGHGLEETASPHEKEIYNQRVREMARSITRTQYAIGFLGFTTPNAEFADAMDPALRALLESGANPVEALEIYFEQNPDANSLGVFRTESASGAPLPATAASLSWMQDNKTRLQGFNSAAPWLMPQDAAQTEEFNQRAWNQQLSLGLREYRNLEEYQEQLFFNMASDDYFTSSEAKEIAVRAAASPEERRHIEGEWKIWKASYLEAHPVFADMLETGKGRSRRAETIKQMTTVLADEGFVAENPMYQELKNLNDSYASYRSTYDASSMGSGRAKTERRAQLAAEFATWASNFVRANPMTKAYYQSVIMPEFRNDTEFTGSELRDLVPA